MVDRALREGRVVAESWACRICGDAGCPARQL